MKIEQEQFLERLEEQLTELEHCVEWSLVGSQLAHGVCIKCKKTIVVQPTRWTYTTISTLLSLRCHGHDGRNLVQGVVQPLSSNNVMHHQFTCAKLIAA